MHLKQCFVASPCPPSGEQCTMFSSYVWGRLYYPEYNSRTARRNHPLDFLSSKIKVSTLQTARLWRAPAAATLLNLHRLNLQPRQSDMLRLTCREEHSGASLSREVAPAPKAHVHPPPEVSRHKVAATDHPLKLLRRHLPPQMSRLKSSTQTPRKATSLRNFRLRCI